MHQSIFRHRTTNARAAERAILALAGDVQPHHRAQSRAHVKRTISRRERRLSRSEVSAALSSLIAGTLE